MARPVRFCARTSLPGARRSPGTDRPGVCGAAGTASRPRRSLHRLDRNRSAGRHERGRFVRRRIRTRSRPARQSGFIGQWTTRRIQAPPRTTFSPSRSCPTASWRAPSPSLTNGSTTALPLMILTRHLGAERSQQNRRRRIHGHRRQRLRLGHERGRPMGRVSLISAPAP